MAGSFKVGDIVTGSWSHPRMGIKLTTYIGLVTEDNEDDSYEVQTSSGTILVELYDTDTMRLATKLDKELK